MRCDANADVCMYVCMYVRALQVKLFRLEDLSVAEARGEEQR